jgi:hypothetical protein
MKTKVAVLILLAAAFGNASAATFSQQFLNDFSSNRIWLWAVEPTTVFTNVSFDNSAVSIAGWSRSTLVTPFTSNLIPDYRLPQELEDLPSISTTQRRRFLSSGPNFSGMERRTTYSAVARRRITVAAGAAARPLRMRRHSRQFRYPHLGCC